MRPWSTSSSILYYSPARYKKPFSPADQEYLRFPPRNLPFVAKVLPSYGIKMLLLDSALDPWVDLWMVDPFPHGT